MRISLIITALFMSSAVHAAPSAELTLNLSGTISETCTIAQRSLPTTITLSDGPGTHDVDYSIDCNSPMSVELKSLRGGLEHDSYSSWADSPGFTGLVAYAAQFQLDVSGAALVQAQSNEMIGGVTGQTGITPFQTDARLHLSWAPEEALLGGRYRDTIFVRVFAEGV